MQDIHKTTENPKFIFKNLSQSPNVNCAIWEKVAAGSPVPLVATGSIYSHEYYHKILNTSAAA